MKIESVSELLTADIQAILNEDELWPASFVTAAQVIDHELKGTHLGQYGRSILLMTCNIAGGIDYCLPPQKKMLDSAAKKFISVLSAGDEAVAESLISRLRLKFDKGLDHKGSDASSDSEDSPSWHVLIDTVMDIVPAQLEAVGLDQKDQWLIIRALCNSFFISSTRCHLYLPLCSNIQNTIRDCKAASEFDGTNIRKIAINYGLSLQRAYAIVKRENKRQKEIRDRVLTQ